MEITRSNLIWNGPTFLRHILISDIIQRRMQNYLVYREVSQCTALESMWPSKTCRKWAINYLGFTNKIMLAYTLALNAIFKKCLSGYLLSNAFIATTTTVLPSHSLVSLKKKTHSQWAKNSKPTLDRARKKKGPFPSPQSASFLPFLFLQRRVF